MRAKPSFYKDGMDWYESAYANFKAGEYDSAFTSARLAHSILTYSCNGSAQVEREKASDLMKKAWERMSPMEKEHRERNDREAKQLTRMLRDCCRQARES